MKASDAAHQRQFTLWSAVLGGRNELLAPLWCLAVETDEPIGHHTAGGVEVIAPAHHLMMPPRSGRPTKSLVETALGAIARQVSIQDDYRAGRTRPIAVGQEGDISSRHRRVRRTSTNRKPRRVSQYLAQCRQCFPRR